jgi:alpha-mannosidase
MTSPVRVFVVPHSHWDREWYEPEARLRQRLVEALDAVVEQLEGDSAERFLLDGQSELLEDYLAVRPDRAARVEALVRAGQLVVGPWYVLADEQLSADETLVRNLLAGRADGRRYGAWMPVGYSPDAFGHPAALPTILAGFGIKSAVVLRGYGGEPGQERDLFRWIGPDGASVLTYHFPPAGFEIAVNLPEERSALQERWDAMRGMLEARATAPVLLAMNGADHHGLQPRILEIVRLLDRMAGGHTVRLGSPADYFAALPPDLDVPEVHGELRFSYRYSWMLQGALSARSGLKRAIAEGERLLLRWAEPQSVLAWLEGGADRRHLLVHAWREHLRNTFHDTICGTASDEVAHDAAARAEKVAIQARGLLLDSLHERLEQDRAAARRAEQSWSPTLAVVNPSAHERRGVVEATLTVPRERLVIGRPGPEKERGPDWPAPPVLRDASGQGVPVQVLGWFRGYSRLDSPTDYPIQDEVAAFSVALEASAVPALGARAYSLGDGTEAEPEPRHVWVSGRRRAAAEWGDVGAGRAAGFTLRDRDRGRQLAQLASVVSERDEGDAYTFQAVGGDMPSAARWSRVREVWGGPLVAAVARDFEIAGRARGTAYARLDAGSRLARFVVDGVNLAQHHRLRVHFPLPGGASSTVSIADSQYGPVTRERREYDPTEFPRELPVNTAPLHRWVSVPGGLMLFARGCFEYELTAERTLAVTVVRAVGDLSRGELAARPGHAGWPTATPGAHELGRFRAEFAVVANSVSEESAPGEWAELERLAEEFHAPLLGLMLPYGMNVPDVLEGPALSGDGLVLKTVKPSEDGRAIVLRCVNVTAERVRGSWTLPFEVDRAHRARLDETPGGEIAVAEDGHHISFEAAPREVVTVRVEPLALVEVE